MSFTFNLGESIKKGWIFYKENFRNIMLFTFILIIVQVIGQVLSKDKNIFISLVFMVIGFLISYVFIKAILNMLDGKGFNPFSKESFPDLASFWDFIKTNILMVLCILPVFIIPLLIIIPGIIRGNAFPLFGIFLLFVAFIVGIFISVRLFASVYLSVEKNQGAVNSIKESWNATRGNVWMIIWKSFLIGLFAIAGILALVVGIFITYPVAMIVITMLYRSLVGPRIISETTISSEITKVEEKIAEQSEVKTEIIQ